MLVFMIAVACAVLAAVALGANNTSNIFGASVRTGVVSFKKAVVYAFALEVLGAFVFGAAVERTFAERLVPIGSISDVYLLVIFLVAALVLFSATYMKLPMSFKQVIVGCMMGYAFYSGSIFEWEVFFEIFLSWVISPVIGIALGFVFYRWLRIRFASDFKSINDVDISYKVFVMMTLISSFFLAMGEGANSLAAITGVFLGAHAVMDSSAVFVAIKVVLGLGVAFGMLFFGRRIMGRLFGGVINADPMMCFSVQLAAFLIVIAFTYMGMPVSCMHVLVGALVGTGLASGTRMVEWRAVREIVSSWIVVVPVAFTACMSMLFVVSII